jgi:allophanate hydrolase
MTLEVESLLAAYRAGLRPSQLARELLERQAGAGAQPVWIARVPAEELLARARELDREDPRQLALYGVPFAVKDNIDVAGMPTSAGCPGFAYEARETAPVVQRLLDAGAMLVGKTNMDQFATGLLGTRSPFGACSSVADPARVSGGSSSGSALAVALDLVAFALGTDTAGSGRVPAAFNGLVGCKPTRGLLSTRGVVPACASLDCVSILTAGVVDAALVLDVAAGCDREDPWSRPEPAFAAPRRERIGVPRPGQVVQEESVAALAWTQALERAGGLWRLVEVDVEPLLAAAPLLYEAWIAERTSDLGEAIAAAPDGLDATVASIVLAGGELRASEQFAARHRLATLLRDAAAIWEQVDALLLPTTALHPTHADVAAEPVEVNARLGSFTNFVNLMDLSALALPGPARADNLPFGVTLHAPAHHDRRLLELGCAWSAEEAHIPFPGLVTLAVAGAHMSGMALNDRLTERGGRLLGPAVTAPCYRLYALRGAEDDVARPGLVHVAEGGERIELELWQLAPGALGELVAEVPAPLAIGRVQLDGGEQVSGFVCEAHGSEGARDITSWGGWRAFQQTAAPASAAARTTTLANTAPPPARTAASTPA